MIFKNIKKYLLVILLVLIPNAVFAYSDYLIASGENIGIKVNSRGLLVVGNYKIDGKSINSDIHIGDTIISTTSISDFTNQINNTNCDNLDVKVLRGNYEYTTTLDLVLDGGLCKTGLYIKDSIIGIGTLTFIDPNTKNFGALGHEIIAKETNSLFKTESGTIFDSEVVSITKSNIGNPGEKNARYYTDKVNGNILKNTKQGIFGNYTSNLPYERLYKVAKPEQIRKEQAKIRTVVNDNIVKEYDILITKLVYNQNIKNIYFDIVDEELLDKTGGVIQGMSGSPIIQGDYIIGAVTHVVVDNPKKGYGIFITNMLEEMEKQES